MYYIVYIISYYREYVKKFYENIVLYTIFLTHLIIGIGTCLLLCIKLIILCKQINKYRIAFTIYKTCEMQQLFITYTYNSCYRYLNVLYLFIENYTCRTS